MRSCKDVSFLLSQSLDRPLPWYTILALRMHLLMCSVCRVARRQALAMGEIVHAYGRKTATGEGVDQPGLPDEARLRIRAQMRAAAKNGSEA